MANLARESNGRKRVQWCEDGKRKTLRLGIMGESHARTMLLRVEKLLALKVTGERPSGELAEWLRDLSDTMRARLVRVGLASDLSATRLTLRALTDELLATSAIKPSTTRNYTRAILAMHAHFGPERLVSSVTESEAHAFKKSQLAQGLAVATVAKYVKVARQLFRRAVRARAITLSPFEDVTAGSQTNATRLRYVSSADIAKVLDAAPNNEWRLAIALARFCGLRCPSEHAELRWVDCDWARSRMTVRSCKTEGKAGHETRVVPIVAEVMPLLRRQFEQASEGSEFVLGDAWRRTGVNRNTQLRRIVRRGGVEVWPKIWQNLRSSCATDFAEKFPQHVAAAWLGHSPQVAQRHYWQIREVDYTRASGQSTSNDAGDSDANAAHNQAQKPNVSQCEAMNMEGRGEAQTIENTTVAASCINSHASRTPYLIPSRTDSLFSYRAWLSGVSVRTCLVNGK